jgi:Lysozyme like domain
MRRLRRLTRIKRERTARENRLYIQQLLCAALLGLIAGTVLTTSLFTTGHRNVIPRVSGEVKTAKVQADHIPFCYDPITCIRDVGEELGVPNQDILTMIRISKCESGLRSEAVNINTNRTIDRGVFQVNSVHKDLSNEDAFNYEKNIRYAYKIFLKQGTRPWVSSSSCWDK